MGSEVRVETTRTNPVRSRRAAREAALQACYQVDVGGSTAAEAIEDALAREVYTPEAAQYIRQVVEGIDQNIQQVNALIKPYLAKGWDWSRIAAVDRCILRIACFELHFMEAMPPRVTINEAVELAKKFGSPESGKFINGVLGSMLPNSPKASWNPQSAPPPPLEEEGSSGQEASSTDEPEVEIIAEGSPEHASLLAGNWTVRSNQTEEEE